MTTLMMCMAARRVVTWPGGARDALSRGGVAAGLGPGSGRESGALQWRRACVRCPGLGCRGNAFVGATVG